MRRRFPHGNGAIRPALAVLTRELYRKERLPADGKQSRPASSLPLHAVAHPLLPPATTAPTTADRPRSVRAAPRPDAGTAPTPLRVRPPVATAGRRGRRFCRSR